MHYKEIAQLTIKRNAIYLVTAKDGSTVRLEFTYYVPRTLNRTVPAYCVSVQFLKRILPTYHTRTITKKAYRTQRCTVAITKVMNYSNELLF